MEAAGVLRLTEYSPLEVLKGTKIKGTSFKNA